MVLSRFHTLFSRISRRQQFIAGGTGLLVLAAVWMLVAGKSGGLSDVLVSPVRGEFFVSVTTTGELQATNSIEIKGPATAGVAGIWQMKISNLVPEGTVVKKGAFVADLDKSDVANRMKESELSVQKLEAQYLQAKLDSTLALSQARDEMVNLQFVLEEKTILMEQSAYEAPAARRQAEIDQNRAGRNLAQARKNYVTKTQQSIAKIQAVEADLMKERQRLSNMATVVQQFTILAPADGMVVYAREWNGKKKIVGSTLSPWEPTVATLPDLRTMESITYVNEIDIQKIAKGQTVRITLDADPKKRLSGVIAQVANIGEQRPNSDSKVFEVRIQINEPDTTLRPSMTTANEILVAKADNVLSIPLEAVHTEGTTTFVYLKNGLRAVKQEVRLGLQNDNNAVVLHGVDERDRVYLVLPDGAEELTLVPLKAAS